MSSIQSEKTEARNSQHEYLLGKDYYEEKDLERTPWYKTSTIIVAEFLGTGVMGLPHACAGLGWVIGCLVCFLFAFISIYSGLLLYRVKEIYPKVQSYSDAADMTLGPKLRKVLTLAIFINWFIVLPGMLMAATSSMISAFDSVSWCYYEWSALVMLFLVVPLQLRTLDSLSWMSVLSNISCVVVVVMVLIDLALDGRSRDVHTDVGVPASTDFLDGYGKLSSFIFAYQGQSMLYEVIREMENFKDFPKALSTSQFTLMGLYMSTTVVAYYFRGDGVDGFLPFSLPNGPLKTISSLLLAFHIAAAYLFTNQPLCNRCHRYFFPHTVQDSSWQGKMHWFAITGVIMAGGYLVANLIPFFSDFTSIIGSLLGGPIMFFFPPIFYLKACAANNRPVSMLDKVACLFFIVIFTPTTMGIGFYSAVKSLVDDWSKFGLPFDCYLVGYDHT